MDSPLLYGIGIGITLAFLIGPVFFALLQISLERGFLAGLFLAIGIAASDAFYIFITNWGISEINDLSIIEYGLGILGGAFMMFFGISTFYKKPQVAAAEVVVKVKKRWYAGLVVKGFLLNAANPGVLIFWVGVVSAITTETDFTTGEQNSLYTAVVATVFITDLAKALLANSIKRLITPNVLKWVNRVIGIVILGIGVGMLLQTFGDIIGDWLVGAVG